jgi:hypothetical protein
MECPVHQCPCEACRVGTGPVAEHHRRLDLILARPDEQQRRWVRTSLRGLSAALNRRACHYPPGASKWNPIEHRPFSQITATWAGVVLATPAVLVGQIRRTTTATGLKVAAREMPGVYPTGRTVTAAEFRGINLTRPGTCPQWNYTIHPTTPGKNTE